MDAKTERNSQILALWKAGKRVAEIARTFHLSWPRTRRIIDEQGARENK